MVKVLFEAHWFKKPPKINHAAFVRAAGRLTRKYSQGAVRALQVYPAERPGQVYRRTFMLRNSWAVIGPYNQRGAIYSDFVNVAYNPGPTGRYYPPYVYGTKANKQAFFHRGRWPDIRTDPNILNERQFILDVQALFDRFMAGS